MNRASARGLCAVTMLKYELSISDDYCPSVVSARSINVIANNILFWRGRILQVLRLSSDVGRKLLTPSV